MAPSPRGRTASQLLLSGDSQRAPECVQHFLRYYPEALLGEGVHLLRASKRGQTPAAIVCRICHLEANTATVASAHEVAHEVAALVGLAHPHLVVCPAAWLDGQQLLVFTEFCPCGTLAKRIKAHAQASDPIPSKVVVRWLSQLASALQYLHERRLTQRDLRPTNILLTEDDEVKLDLTGSGRLPTPGAVAPHYLAPELLLRHMPSGATDCPFEADLWSLGTLLFELLTLRRPFEAEGIAPLVQKITNAAYDHSLLESCAHPPDLRQLASNGALLQQAPSRRLTLPRLQEQLLELMWTSPVGSVTEAYPSFLVLPTAGAPNSTLAKDGSPFAPLASSEAKGVEAGAEAGAEAGTQASAEAGAGAGTPSAAPATPRRSSPTKAPRVSFVTEVGGEEDGAPSAASPESNRSSPVRLSRVSFAADTAVSFAADAPAPLRDLAVPSLNLDAVNVELGALESALHGTSRIPHNQLSVGAELGHGTYSTVYRAVRHWKRTSQPVAVKKLHGIPADQIGAFSPRAQDLLQRAVSRTFCEEVKMLSKLRHANIVTLFGLCVMADASLALVMELLERSLFDELHPRGPTSERAEPLPMPVVVKIALGCAQGLTYLHDTCRVAHRDIKSPNILLAEDGRVKLSDFGLSREVLVAAPMTRAGSLVWAAPEVLKGLKYDCSCDQWSFAVVLWELLTGAIPYKDMSYSAIVREVALGTNRLPLPLRGPKALLRLMALCFNDEPEERPRFREIAANLVSVGSRLAA